MDVLPVLPIDIADCHILLGAGIGPFTSSLMVMRFVEGGHVTVTHAVCTVRRDDQETTREKLTPEQVIVAVQELGMELDQEYAEALFNKVSELQAIHHNSP